MIALYISNEVVLSNTLKYMEKGGNTLILLGLMFLIIGMIVLTGTYIIYAFVVFDLMNDPLYDATILSLIIPSALFFIFLVAIVTVIIKLLRDEEWRRLYIITMIYFFISISFYYIHMAQALKDLILFVIFCFIFALVLIFIGFKRMQKKQKNSDSLT